MNTKEFTNYSELENYLQDLVDEKKWAIDVRQNTKSGIYQICWIEQKSYTTHDGKEFPDEVWVTQDGRMMCVQDLEPEHAKNVLRMLLRNERANRELMQQALEAMAENMIDDDEMLDEAATSISSPQRQFLH